MISTARGSLSTSNQKFRTLEDAFLVSGSAYAAFRALLQEELDGIRARLTAEQLGDMQLSEAAILFEEMIAHEEFAEFLTVPAYERLAALKVSKE